MKVRTHALVGAAAGFVLAPNIVCFAACVLGAVTPDYLDLMAAKMKYMGKHLSWDAKVDIWAKLHRTWSHNMSHWLFPLFIVLLIPFVFPAFLGHPYARPALAVCEYFCIGALSHVFCDFLTPMGVGWLPLMSSDRISARLIKTNSWLDSCFGFFVFAAGAAYFVLCRDPGLYADLRKLSGF